MPQSILHPAPFRVPLLDAHGQLVETWRRFFLSTQNLINEILISDRPGLGTPHPALLADDSGADADAWITPGPPGAAGAPGPPGIAGMDGQESDEGWWLSGFPASSGITDVAHGGTGANLAASAAIGDLLVANAAATFARLADVAVNSLLISKGIGVAPAWADNVNLGTSNSGFLNISGKSATNYLLADDGVVAQSVTATFPATITATRVGIGYQVVTAGSSAFGQVGMQYTVNAGYTGNSTVTGLLLSCDVANPNNQTKGIRAALIGAGLSNCALVGISNNATNGNIGVYGAIGGFSEGNFNFNVTAAILASNGATTNDIYRGYSSTTLKFAITDAGHLTLAGKATTYNNIATVSNGVPSEYAKIDTTGLTANVGATTLYAVPASGAGMYRISAYVVETTAGSLSSTLPNVQVVYTDNDTGGSITMDATPVLGVAGIGQTGALTANTVGTASSGVIVINVQASTTIQYQTVNYASNLAGMAYAIHLKLEAL